MIDLEEARRRIEREAALWKPAVQSDYWDEWSQKPHEKQADIRVRGALCDFLQAGRSGRVAVDLGGGGINESALLLLGQNWKVHVVDTSRVALDVLKNTVHERLPDAADRLTLCCEDMGDYKFPENVSIIFAHDSLFYCNPDKFLTLWDRAFNALEDGGYLIGNTFARPSDKKRQEQARADGAWFMDSPTIYALLRKKYEILELDDTDNCFMREPKYCSFVACKIKSD